MIERWLAAIRDDPDRPPPHQVNVLTMLALRMNWKTGSGHASREQLAADADASGRTVERATGWARKSRYAVQTRRGHRMGNGKVAASEWELSVPATRDGLTIISTRQSSRLNPTAEHHHQESSTSRPSSSRRTTRTGSRGEPAATDDDDDFDLSTNGDSRKILASFGATEDETEFGIRLLARLTPDPAGYLRGKSGDPEGFMRWLCRERQLDGQDDAEGGP